LIRARVLLATRFVWLMLVVLGASASSSQAATWDDGLLDALRIHSTPLRSAADLEPLVDAVDDARLLLLGESTHGTHEFYGWRDRLSRRLISERGFSFIAVEGDWSALVPLDRYVRHRPDAPASARTALLTIERWPRWVWANEELAELGEWLRLFNRGRAAADRIGIHGIDLYGVSDSIDAVQRYYQAQWPTAADRVRKLYQSLRGFDGDAAGYVEHIRRDGSWIGDGVAGVASELAARLTDAPPDERNLLFETLQHARVVASGERYLRALAEPAAAAWNARDRHFERMLGLLLDRYGPNSRAVVWAHNTHIGDARATEMAARGEVNLGQLLRERYGAEAVFAVGFGTATGSVLAASAWGEQRQPMQLPPPRQDSLEAALLASTQGNRILRLGHSGQDTALSGAQFPQRAIGVVFAPAHESDVNYVATRLVDCYDAYLFLPVTRAVIPLHAE